MKLAITPDQYNVNVPLKFNDSTSTSNGGHSSISGSLTGLTGYYWKSDGTPSTSMTLSGLGTFGVYSPGTLIAVDSTNTPGHAQFSLPNAAKPPVGGGSTFICFKGGTNMCQLDVELVTVPSGSYFTKNL